MPPSRTPFAFSRRGRVRLRDWRDGRDREFKRVMQECGVPPRRAQVARGVLRGYCDKDIAASMQVSVDAVKKHKRLLYFRFEVHDRGSFAKALRRLMGDEAPPVFHGAATSRIRLRPALLRRAASTLFGYLVDTLGPAYLHVEMRRGLALAATSTTRVVGARYPAYSVFGALRPSHRPCAERDQVATATVFS